MKKFLIIFLIILLNIKTALSRNIGETEITTDDGIEVFQEEKYYLLKKNVIISSDDLELTGQIVKIFFKEDLYDITDLIAEDNVDFFSDNFKVKGSGQKVIFNFENQKIFISGIESKIYLENTEMLSDGEITINNIDGSFLIEGENSRLLSDDIIISGSIIKGIFNMIDGKRDIANLSVEDKKKINIKTNDILMSSNKAIYNKSTSQIELFENVEINRKNEIINGDYGILDTKKNSYKVSSKKTSKVKAIILESNE